jgi:uncharacterized protein YxeA
MDKRMKREDLKIIKKVISEEGMKKEIGALIDLHHPIGKAPLFSKKVIIGVTILATSIAIILAYYLTNNSNEEIANNNFAIKKQSVEKPKEKNNIESKENSLDVNAAIKNSDDLNSKLSEEGSIKLKESFSTNNAISAQPIGAPKSLTDKPRSNIFKTKQKNTNAIVKEESAFSSSEKKKRKVEDFSIKESPDSRKITNKEGALEDQKGAIDTSNSNKKESNTNLEKQDTSERNNKEYIPSPKTTPLDSLAQNDQQDSTANDDKKERKWNVKLGFGYGFLSTGDIRNTFLHNELTYQLAPRWKTGFETSFGRSTTDPAIENTSYIQNGLNMYFSPLKSTHKYQLNLGIGPSFYSLSRTYRQTSAVIGGQPQYKYFSEKRTDFGLGFIIENRYSLSETISIGARFSTHQYLKGDAITGINLNLGIHF